MSFPRYPQYKASGVEWLGEVPEYWLPKRADAVLDTCRDSIEAAGLVGKEVFHYSIPVVQETGDGQLEDGTEIESSKLVVSEPQVLVSKLNPRKGTVCIASPKDVLTVCSGEFVPLIPRVADIHFVCYLVQTDNYRQRLESLVESATRSHQRVLPSDVLRFRWVFPPLAEQTNIAAFLDRETAKIDELVGEQRRLIELLREKRQAVISHAITKGLNPDAPLKSSGIEWLGDVPEHWTIPPLYVRYNQVLGKMLDHGKMTGKHPTPYLRNLDVRWDYINVEDLPVMDIAPHERERFTVRKGDLLMVEGRELGRSAIWQGDDGVIGFQKALHRLRPLNRSEHTRYFFYLMIFVNGTGAFVANQSPNEIPHLTGEELRKHRFPKPPYAEQVAITEYLDEMTQRFDALAAEAQHAIDLLQERRTAIISAAITGQIDVRPLNERQPV